MRLGKTTFPAEELLVHRATWISEMQTRDKYLNEQQTTLKTLRLMRKQDLIIWTPFKKKQKKLKTEHSIECVLPTCKIHPNKDWNIPRGTGISVQEAVSTGLKGKASEERAGRARKGGKEKTGPYFLLYCLSDLGPQGNRNRVSGPQKAIKKGVQVMTTQHALQTPCKHYS